MERMDVIKTLVIGLGSSGIEICDLLVDRIRWELGDVKRAPWIRFLGIETNQTVNTDLREQGDLLLLTLSAEEYRALLAGHSGYEERLRIREWADEKLLRLLPGNAVTEGAGNIRMVGRLVFFYNYDSISREVSRRLNDLRRLSEAEALETRGELANGENPPLTFVGNIRIFVVGTLCGGTCSGMAGDFGFFLRLTASPDERIIGIFTLPPANLTSAVERKAERYKRNAYAALVELNHYHLVNRQGENPIIFPDGRRADFAQTPYDHPYLVFPQGIDKPAIDQMHRVIADRIFLNIFAPGTDSFRRTVDAPQASREEIREDRYARAHVFLSMGIATMEYPAERIIAACTAKQLAYTLMRWNNRTITESEINARLRDIGLEWSLLRSQLLQKGSGQSFESIVYDECERIKELSSSSVKEARDSLDKLRAAFNNLGILITESEGLSRGSVTSGCWNNCSQAVKECLSRIRSLVERDLLDYSVGPAAIRDTMRAAIRRLEQLTSPAKHDISDDSRSVDTLLDKIDQCNRSKKLKFAGLHAKEKRRLLGQLIQSLKREMQRRLDNVVQDVIKGASSAREQKGLAPTLKAEIEVIVRRLQNLIDRVNKQQDLFDSDYNRLLRDEPQVSGKVLFAPGLNGTVNKEYESCLETEQQGITWEQQRELLAREIIQGWNDLVEKVVPLGNIQPQEDWLYNHFNPTTENPFPRDLIDPITRQARRPFLKLLKSNVYEKWWNHYTDSSSRTEDARQIVRGVVPTVNVDRYLAEQGGRSPIATWSILVAPSQGERRREFMDVVRFALPTNCEEADSPYPYRIIMLQEWQRWPLSGVREITVPGGLCSARCNDFPSFHTRKDVAWTPLTDEEVKKVIRLRHLLALGVLCEIVRAEQRHLRLKRDSTLAESDWLFPLSIRSAAHMIVTQGQDVHGEPITYEMTDQILRQRILNKREQFNNDERFVEFLIDRKKKRFGSEISDLDPKLCKEAIVDLCSSDEQLRRALMSVNPIRPELKQSLYRKPNDRRPWGGYYEKEGYYCTKCGGLIGENEEEALRNGWCCYVNPDHCFYTI